MMFFLFMVVFIGLAMLAIYGLSRAADKESKRVNGELDKFKARTNAATTLPELETIYEELLEYAKKECTYKYHYYSSTKLMTYIRGKYAGIKCVTVK